MSVLFLDAYGTILDTGDGSVRATAQILRSRGCDLDPVEVYARWKSIHRHHLRTLEPFVVEAEVFRRDLALLYGEIGVDGNPSEDVRPMLETLGARRAYSDVRSALARLRRSYRIVVASNSDSGPLLADLARNSIEVDGVFSSESLEAYKPAPEFYHLLLERTGVGADRAVFCGDSLEEDIGAPGRIGMQTVWMNRTHRTRSATDPVPDREICSLSELVTEES